MRAQVNESVIRTRALDAGGNFDHSNMPNRKKKSLSFFCSILTISLLVFTSCVVEAQVRINELLAANVSTNLDPDAWEFSDWIELHNIGDSSVDLTGYFLTDDLSDPTKWQIPGGAIDPGQHLLCWADGLDLPARNLPSRAAADLEIFTDSLVATWEFRNRSRAVLEVEVMHQGQIAVAVHSDLFTFDLLPAVPVELAGYGSLTFAFHPGQAVPGVGVASFNVLLKSGQTSVVRLLGDDVIGAQIDLDEKQWQVIEIPLDLLALEQPLTAITFGGNVTGTFYLDNIRLVPREQPVYHASFKLNLQGEELGLFSPDGILVDSVVYGEQIPGVSQGRQVGGDQWLFFDDPTPGGANGLNGLPEAVVSNQAESSLPARFYQGQQTLTLSHSRSDAVMRYTIDGSIPTRTSREYLAPIVVATTTVVRVRSYVPGELPSPVLTRTYFIDEAFDLPVFSISTDPDNLWDDQIGIYVDGTNGVIADDSVLPKNSNQSWERPAHVEFYESDDTPAFSQQMGVSIYGAFSRHFPQKSLSLIARGKYGEDAIRHRLFLDKGNDRYKSFILRNGGNDWLTSMIDDPLMQTLVEGAMDVDVQDYRPAVLFLNGRYWGLHNIREKLNRHYAASNYGVDPDEIDIVEGDGLAKAGDAVHYRSTIDYLETHDLSRHEAYERVGQLLDVVEYMNVQIALIYYGPSDNFFKNVKSWRPRTAAGRWRWFLYDTDHGFYNFRTNAVKLATDPQAENRFGDISWGTLILRKLLENHSFKDDFIQRFAAHINYTFAVDRVVSVVDSLEAGIAAEMPRHIQRWKDECAEHAWWGPFCGIASMDKWKNEVNRLRSFARNRPVHVRRHLSEYFNLPDLVELKVVVGESGGGRVLVNDVPASGEGLFFKKVPLRLTAVPRSGFSFVGWGGALAGTLADTTLVLQATTRLEATFAPNERAPQVSGVYINEVLADNDSLIADAHGDHDDWIEIYNAGPSVVDIGGLFLTDRFDQPTLWQIPLTQPELTTIKAGQFLLLWADRETEQGILHADFKLNADGEQLALVQLRGNEVVYLDSFSFGTQEKNITFGRYPDGGNNIGLLSVPTPTGNNEPFLNTTVVKETSQNVFPAQFILGQNYPNPFNSSTVIHFNLPTSDIADLSIYNIAGQKVATLAQGMRQAGTHVINWNGKDDNERLLTSGLYFYRLQSSTQQQTRKLLLLR